VPDLKEGSSRRASSSACFAKAWCTSESSSAGKRDSLREGIQFCVCWSCRDTATSKYWSSWFEAALSKAAQARDIHVMTSIRMLPSSLNKGVVEADRLKFASPGDKTLKRTESEKHSRAWAVALSAAII